MIGGYQKNQQDLENDADWPETRAAQAVFAGRCAICHHEKQCPIPRSLSDEIGLSFWAPDMSDPRLRHSRHIVFNLTRPEKSLVLLAPLARAAGGYGLCQPPDAPAEASAVFANRDDPGYRDLLALCEAGRRRLDEIKRFDMPGFRPRPQYVREMKRYGVLPPSFDAALDPIDTYAVDRQYWDLFGWEPGAAAVGWKRQQDRGCCTVPRDAPHLPKVPALTDTGPSTGPPASACRPTGRRTAPTGSPKRPVCRDAGS